MVKDATKVRLLTGLRRDEVATATQAGAGLIDAKVVQVDAANDLALLKADGRFACLPIAASRTVALGGTVATVGFPDIGFNAKAQSRQDARQTLSVLCALAPLRLCVNFFRGHGFCAHKHARAPDGFRLAFPQTCFEKIL